MRVMVIVKATKDSEAGVMPSTKLLEDMGKFNEELVKAGIMLAGDGLKSSEGVGVAAVVTLAGLVVNALLGKPDSYPLALALVGLGLLAVGVAWYGNARSRVKSNSKDRPVPIMKDAPKLENGSY